MYHYIFDNMENQHQSESIPENFAEKTAIRRNIWRRVGIISAIIVGLILLAGLILPYFYRDEIVRQLKVAINKDLNAKVDFGDVSLSILSSFPDFTLRLNNLKITGLKEFKDVTLADIEALDIRINFWSVYDGSPYEVKALNLRKPFLNIVVLPNGKANYDITKPSKTTSEPSDFKLTLDRYGIADGHLRYDDRSMGFFMEMKNLDHLGRGKMTSSVYDLDTKTTADSMDMSYGAMSYLSSAHVDLDAILGIDVANMKFAFKDNTLIVNDLTLKADGFFRMMKDAYQMDLKFDAPENDFKNFLSLIPGAYTTGFADVDATGALKFDGFVKGTYNDKGQLPAFAVNLGIGNAKFKYPDLPLGVTDIAADVRINSPTSNFNDMKIDVPKLKFKLGSNPFEADFYLRTPISDPDVNTTVKGIIDLGSLAKAFPMEGVKQLSGIINADVVAKTRMSYIDQKAYDKINMSGKVQIKQMRSDLVGSPDILINDMNMAFTPNNVQLSSFDAKIGKSDIKANGTIDNILAYFSPDRTMTGDLMFRSANFDANEWVSSEPTMENASPSSTPVSATEKVFDRFNFTLDGAVNRLVYDKYTLTNTTAKGNFTPNRMQFDQFGTQIGASDLRAKGTISNVFDYLFDKGILGGNIDIASNNLDLNQFMTASTTTETAPTSGVLLVPDNIDMAVNTNIKALKYTNIDMQNVVGKVVVKDRQARIDNGSANLLGGALGFAGGYNTENAQKPLFDLKYDVRNFDFQRTFLTFNTVQKLAPIAKFIDGKFNTTMVLSGEVGKDMTPNLNTLNITGFLNTIQAVIRNFKPLDDMANKLNLSALRNMELKDTKNWIEVANGMFELKDFDYKYKDILMRIGGKHGISQDMDYHVSTKVPRKMLEQGSIGAAAGAGYSQLLGEAAKYGINIKNGEFVNVLFGVLGTIIAPKLTMKLLGSDGESVQDAATDVATAVVEKAKDTLRTRANQELDKGKQKAKDAADRAVDSAAAVVKQQVDKAKDKAIDEVTRRAGEQVGGAVGKKADDILRSTGAGEKTKQEVDKMKDKLDKFNPFGGKKKNGGGG